MKMIIYIFCSPQINICKPKYAAHGCHSSIKQKWPISPIILHTTRLTWGKYKQRLMILTVLPCDEFSKGIFHVKRISMSITTNLSQTTIVLRLVTEHTPDKCHSQGADAQESDALLRRDAPSCCGVAPLGQLWAAFALPQLLG